MAEWKWARCAVGRLREDCLADNGTSRIEKEIRTRNVEGSDGAASASTRQPKEDVGSEDDEGVGTLGGRKIGRRNCCTSRLP
jgi:hypothetical protein